MKFYNQIPVEKVDMVEKIAFLYWYEHMLKMGYKLTPKDTQLYEKIKHEVMDFGFNYSEKNK
jgi:hypothetical protein